MRTTIGLTSGDPAGIGLEVTFKALPAVLQSARWVLFTDPYTFEQNYSRFGSGLPYRWITRLEDITDAPLLFLLGLPAAGTAIPFGQSSPEAGLRALASLRAAADAATAGHLQAIVTAPVNKASIGADFVGQTEFLAEHAGSPEFAMAFFTPTFKVVLATVHVALKDALKRLSTRRYVDLIHFVRRELLRFGFAEPRIAVAAINPHAGEEGMFGREDIDVLRPAVEQCAAMGIAVSGPHSADSLYYRAHTGEFDVVIAPYHDQGLIPVKLIAHSNSTNVTLGLPYVRTSPDHGTAFGIAGQGRAEAEGMRAAMQCAVTLTQAGDRSR